MIAKRNRPPKVHPRRSLAREDGVLVHTGKGVGDLSRAVDSERRARLRDIARRTSGTAAGRAGGRDEGRPP